MDNERNADIGSRIATFIPWLHGTLYVVTGVWPLLHMRSFELVTGPKRDKWLVNTVGLLVAVQGAIVLRAATKARAEGVLSELAIGSALALAAIDIRYVIPGRISRIYLVDAILEVALAVGWLFRRNRAAD
jgi:hypothetical protein